MPTFLQQDRPLQVTGLGGQDFLLASINGQEAISRPYSYRLTLRSEKSNVDAKSLLRAPVAVEITTVEGGSARVIHGRVSRFVQLGERDNLTAYAAEIVPWLWFLSLARNSRIFQNKSVLEIVQQVFRDAGYTDFRVGCNRSYDPREYCVQYRESDLDFVSRLMEEEGIFYFFEHTKTKHTLVLGDTNSAFPTGPALPALRTSGSRESAGEAVLSFELEHAVHPGKTALQDYNFEQPSTSLLASAAGTGPEEVYDYPGGYGKRTDGDRLSKRWIEEVEVLQQVARAESTVGSVQAGTKVDLEKHNYLIVEASIAASAENFRAWDGSGFEYQNKFLAIPGATPYRPPRRTPRPTIPGTQTALVVGKAGEEIWTDKYGRVKVQFYWDRKGKKDENSSCWVRVASSWAGKGWGAVQIPRMGQEVVVAFLEGDPDRPLVVGSVYNAEQVVAYTLPGEQTKSYVRSRSSKGGTSSKYNEIVLEDKKDSEKISVQAEKDLATLVKNDETRDVQHDRTTTIKNNDTRTVKEGNCATTVSKGNQTIEVTEGNQTTQVKKGNHVTEVAQGSHSLKVHKDHSVSVEVGDDSLTVSQGKQTTHVKGDTTLTIDQGNHTVDVKMGDQTIRVQMGNQDVNVAMGNQTIQVRMGNRQVKVNMGSIKEEAMQGIELKVGTNSIKIDPSGITIKGLMVKIQGQVQTEVKGLMTTVKGDAMLQAGGAITMLG